MGYVVGSSGGFNTVTISDAGAATTSGTGPLTGFTGGGAGSTEVSTTGLDFFVILFGGSLQIKTNNTTSSYRVETPGCGAVNISNFTTTSGATTASISSYSATFPLGATLTIDSFTSSTGCTISGTVTGPVGYKLSSSGSYTDLPVNITVYIAPHMSLAHPNDAALNFGSICRSSTAQQSITVRPDGTATSSNNVCPLTPTTADVFTATGNAGQSFNVKLPTSATLSNGSNTLTVTDFTSSCNPSCVVTDSSHTFTVGGTLTIPAGAATGDYEGAYQVSITY